MRLLIAVVAVLGFLSSAAQAVLVVEDTNMAWETTNPYGVDYFGRINQEPGSGPLADYTGALFNFPVGVNFEFEGAGFLVDEGSTWYLVETGDVFTEQAIRAGEFLPIAGGFSDLPGGNNSIQISGEEFYLGVVTGEEFNYDVPTVFGWIKLGLTDTFELEMLDNAVSYASKGIIIGTSIAIPEPSSMVLLLGSFVGMAARRFR